MDYKELDTWKKSRILVKKIYQLIDLFPKSKEFGLKSQIRRSVVSIPSNIAEGSARSSDKEFIQFLYYSLGSACELETQIILAIDLKFIASKDILEKITEVKKLISGLIKYLKNK